MWIKCGVCGVSVGLLWGVGGLHGVRGSGGDLWGQCGVWDQCGEGLGLVCMECGVSVGKGGSVGQCGVRGVRGVGITEGCGSQCRDCMGFGVSGGCMGSVGSM